MRGSLPCPALLLAALFAAAPLAASPIPADARELALRAPAGSTSLDHRIATLQAALHSLPEGSPRFEELGWMFMAQARAENDESAYRRAEACAAVLNAARPGSAAALLLKGHALQSMHRFAEAEASGRTLVATRGLAYDYGLLGDALMEQGRLDEATDAYQAMMDRKPGAQAYARAAHLRWLHGDAFGAAGMMELAVEATSPRDAEALAWAYAQLGNYRFRLGRFASARAACDRALAIFPGHAAALAMRGRISLAQGKASAAIPDLATAARIKGLPETQWAVADAMRLAGRSTSADSVEASLATSGERTDPRSFSLFLATRERDITTALRLAQHERSVRGDAYTHDAIAWAAFAAGDFPTASAHADSALSRGIRDARVFLHGGLIARAAGREADALKRLQAARGLAYALLPSERKLLEHVPASRRE